METALYYLFSTIAQTLAAALALIAAFTLYKMQILESKIKETSLLLINFYKEPELELLHLTGKYEELFAKIEAMQKDNNDIDVDKSSFKNMRMLLNHKKLIIRYLNKALFRTSLTILYSIIMIPMTPIITKYNFCCLLAILIGIFLVSWLLALYHDLILKSIFPNQTMYKLWLGNSTPDEEKN